MIPAAAVVFLTQDCDRACPHCFNTLDPDKPAGADHLDIGACLAFLTAAAARGLKKVVLTGGEPLLHPGALTLVHGAHALGLEQQLFTSGTGLAEQGATLAAAGLGSVRFSFNELPYLGTSQQLDRIWPALVDRIRPALASFPGGVEVNLIVSRTNLPLLEEVYGRLAELGIERIKVQPLLIEPDSPFYERLTLHGLRPDATDVSRMKAQRFVGQSAYVELFWRYYSQGWRPERCGAAPMLVVAPDGTVHPCLHRFDLQLGRLDTDTPDEILDQLPSFGHLRAAACFREACLSLQRPQA